MAQIHGAELTDTASKQTIFELPDSQPDTRLVVFKHEFHVHSIVLRLYSGFFRKFLDSNTEKQTSGGDFKSSLFRYEYVAKDDGDGVWGLQPPRKTDIDDATTLDEAAQITAAQTLHDLLSVFYLRRYKVKHFQRLDRLVTMADFYCALPIVSIFLDATLPTDSSLLNEIPDKAPQFLSCARKLKSSTLFREAFVHVVGQWNLWNENKREDFRRGIDTRLLDLVEIYHGRIREKVAVVSQFLLLCSISTGLPIYYGSEDYITEEIVREELQMWRHQFSEGDEAKFYRKVWGASFAPSDELTERYRVRRSKPKIELAGLSLELQNKAVKSVHNRLDSLMENHLLLDRSGEGAGQGRFEYFLCTELVDKDLPWDTDQFE